MTLGSPSYTFQYNNQTSGIDGGTRSISGININDGTAENPDGITPSQLYDFMLSVMSALNISIGTTLPKLITNQIYQPEGGN